MPDRLVVPSSYSVQHSAFIVQHFLCEAHMGFNKILTKVLGSRNERLLKKYWRRVEAINAIEPKIQAMSDDQLRERTLELHDGLLDKKLTKEEVLPEAFAIIREAMDRNIGIRQIFSTEQSEFQAKFD